MSAQQGWCSVCGLESQHGYGKCADCAQLQLEEAAPALLDALRSLVNCHTGAAWQTQAVQREAWVAARAALAQADGEVGKS